MLWIVAIPLYDLCWAVIRRSIRGIPPFRSDDGHFHHMVLRAGIGVQGAFVLLVALAVLLASFGIGLDRLGASDSWSLALLVAAGILIVNQLHHPSIFWTLVRRVFRGATQTIPD